MTRHSAAVRFIRFPWAAFLFVFIVVPRISLIAQTPYESGELLLALEKLETLGSVLYIAAHPDDENTAFLATMAKQLHYRTGNLSITRGEGGQNLLGAEQGDALGVIRTQELLSARRIDGAEQFFTRAVDFGYSKSSDETLAFWGKEATLADVVWVVRKFRPDVIVTRFTPTRGGHGNHTASAMLAQEAFRAAADPHRFPEQLHDVRPWQAKRIVWNEFRFTGQPADSSGGARVAQDLGAYNPVLGLSIGELAGKSRSMHKSQGFGASEFRGTNLNAFVHIDGDPAAQSLFDGIQTGWQRIPGGAAIGNLLRQAVVAFRPGNPSAILPLLLQARAEMLKIKGEPWVEVKLRDLDHVVLGCCGIWFDATAATPQATPGSSVQVTVALLNRSAVPCIVHMAGVSSGARDTVIDKTLDENIPFEIRLVTEISSKTTFTQPYWLEHPRNGARYEVNDLRMIGSPESPAAAIVHIALMISGARFDLEAPVRYRWVDPTGGERYRALRIVPPVSVAPIDRVALASDGGPAELGVVVNNMVPLVTGNLTLNMPPGWRCEPSTIPFAFDSQLTDKNFHFRLIPAPGAGRGTVVASAVIGARAYDQTVLSVAYPHIATQSYLATAKTGVFTLDMHATGMRIGYIAGAGDDVPAALTQLGFTVELISDDELESVNLRRFDAIVAGVRAYNTREKLRSLNGRLMDYVAQGGRYLVQYTTSQRMDAFSIGPFPFRITQDRVSVEEAPMTPVLPDHPLLNTPNRIGPGDFDGWVQERGLYFAGSWAPQYETPLESHDPGEDPRKGGLLYARYGKGYFVYTGLSFFRQLPAGVPGAYRLLVNILSQRVEK